MRLDSRGDLPTSSSRDHAVKERCHASDRSSVRAACSLCRFHRIPAHAETFHTGGTVIASLPAVITTQGVFCLTHDLTTAITSGTAIDIQVNNVTIDCNGCKIGGLAAGTSSTTRGIYAV